MADVSHHQRKTHNKSNRRCQEPKCAKLARDEINGEFKCRIHSPMRLGCVQRLNKENKKK